MSITEEGASLLRAYALAVIILLTCVLTVPRTQAANPRIYLDPSLSIFYTSTTIVGAKFNVTLWIENVANIGGVQIHIDFDDGVINATRWFEPKNDPQYIFYGRTTSALPTPPNDVGYMHVGPDRGRAFVCVSLFPPTPPYFTGNGKICTFEFEIKNAPPINGQLTSTLHIDSNNTYALDGNSGTEVPGVLKDDGLFVFSYSGYWLYRCLVLWGSELFEVFIESNSTISNFLFAPQTRTIAYNVSGTTGTTGTCNVSLPKPLVDGPFLVLVDGEVQTFSSISNSTHNILYFSYPHSSHTVHIIGTQAIGGPVRNLNTGLTYMTIQGAIDAPETRDGHTILVAKGTYSENVVVTKVISLLGENTDLTIIDGGVGNAMIIEADNVTLSGFTIRANYNGTYLIPTEYGIILPSNNCIISRNKILQCDVGINLAGNNNTISGNTINRQYDGIMVQPESSGNIIIRNTITNSGQTGIDMLGSTSNNTMSTNTISASGRAGISLWNTRYNTIVYNDVKSNAVGIELGMDAEGNRIFHNTLMNNVKQVLFDLNPPLVNVWDDGYPSGGNYWSDYDSSDIYSGPYQNETGSDGVGDTPYIVGANGKDLYPLMSPYHGPVRNLNTGESYLTIQEAIDNSIENDRILVLSGTYYENIVVNKPISLIGEDRSTTCIDGNFIGSVVTVTASGSCIRGFRIQNSGSDTAAFDSGVTLDHVQKCIIEDNDLSNNHWGVFLYWSNASQVTNNYISNSVPGIGVVMLSQSFGNFIERNTIIQPDFYGIYLQTSCNNNTLSSNTICSPNSEGIVLHDSHGNKITCNEISSSYRSVRLTVSNENWVYHNNFIDNTVRGYDDGVGNNWDDGYPSGGNYWSDYVGQDLYRGSAQDQLGSDGIGDTPYSLIGDSPDRYPLMSPYVKDPTSLILVLDPEYTREKQVTITATYRTNNTSVANAIVLFEIRFPNGSIYLRQTNDTDASGTTTFSFKLEASVPFGDYSVLASAYRGSFAVAEASTSFVVLYTEPRLQMLFDTPGIGTVEQESNITLRIKNVGNATAFNVHINLTLPNGLTLLSGETSFTGTIGIGEEIVMNIKVTASKPGKYGISASAYYETGDGAKMPEISTEAHVIIAWDSSYPADLTDMNVAATDQFIELNITVTNFGDSSLDLVIAVSAQHQASGTTLCTVYEEIHIASGETKTIQFSVIIPENALSGDYIVQGTMLTALPSEGGYPLTCLDRTVTIGGLPR